MLRKLFFMKKVVLLNSCWLCMLVRCVMICIVFCVDWFLVFFFMGCLNGLVVKVLMWCVLMFSGVVNWLCDVVICVVGRIGLNCLICGWSSILLNCCVGLVVKLVWLGWLFIRWKWSFGLLFIRFRLR